MAIIVCSTCGKMIGKDNGPRGIKKTLCILCGFKALAEEDMLSKEEADLYNQYLRGEVNDQQVSIKLQEMNKT